MAEPLVVAIVGPTAVGKSAVAMELAERLDAHILSADSRQVYRYMDIGTAKPSRTDRARVTHYLVDVVDPSQPYSLQRFRDEARRVLERCRMDGRPVLVVGGTGFYIHGLLDGLDLAPAGPNRTLRTRLNRVAEAEGPPSLHARLARLDPASAARIHPNNLNRVIRALEIIETTGGPVPAAAYGRRVDIARFGLGMERAELYQRADERAARHFQTGLIRETELLLAMDYSADLPPLRGFGYRHTVELLRGRLSQAEALAAYQQATRQYIRRQVSWFRHDPLVEWVDVAARSSKFVTQHLHETLQTRGVA